VVIDGRGELTPAEAAGIEAAIAASMARMGHLVAEYPIYVRPPEGRETMPAATMIDTAHLRAYFERAIRDWSPDPTIEDERAAASRFMRRYVGSVAIAALVPVLNGVAFDVAIPRVQFVMSTYPGQSDMPMGVVLDLPAEVLGTADRPTPWPLTVSRFVSLDELRATAVRSMINDHLEPAIARVLEAVHLSPKVLWASVAEVVDLIYEGYFEGADPRTSTDEYARAEADKAAVLMVPQLPGIVGPNPMFDLLEWERIDDQRLPRPVHWRKVCCANFVIPGRPTPYCRTCGLLPAEERSRLWREFAARLAQG